MMNYLRVLLITPFIVGCGGKNTGNGIDTNSDTSTDSDADTNPDSDSDMDTDAFVIGGDWITINSGSFWMGSPDGNCPVDYPGGPDCAPELGRKPDEELHYVTLTHSFKIQSTEVTLEQYEEVIGNDPTLEGAGFPECHAPDCPVHRVTIYDAMVYANMLSTITDRDPCYVLDNITCDNKENVGTDDLACATSERRGIDIATISLNNISSLYTCNGYRLPTEAEWEYAARAGSITAFYPSEGNDGSITGIFEEDPNLDLIGWYYNNSGDMPHPVGQKEPNEWGLYDMSGNVSEWILAELDSYPSGDKSNPVIDPEGVLPFQWVVYRGGSYLFHAVYSRSAIREASSTSADHEHKGFRIVRSLF